MRVKFYREHKYVSYALSELERRVAKTDFRDAPQVDVIESEWKNVSGLLKSHANYEDEKLHRLLENKGSTVHLRAHDDHHHQDEGIEKLESLLGKIKNSKEKDEKIELGYQFYLNFRKFVAENLLHLHEEETNILPELQRLYSDEELKEVENATYRIMTKEELVDMLSVLFPHMNLDDKETFLSDIKFAQPEKFAWVWEQAKEFLKPHEEGYIKGYFHL